MEQTLTGCGKTFLAQQNFDCLHVWDTRRTSPQDAQKGRPARPQRAKRRRRTLRYVELLSEARMPLADFFSILLHVCCPSGEGAQSCHMISCRGSPASPQPNPRLAMWTGSAVCWNIAASESKNFACDPPTSKPPICCYLDTFPLNRSSRDGTRTSSITVASSSRLSIY